MKLPNKDIGISYLPTGPAVTLTERNAPTNADMNAIVISRETNMIIIIATISIICLLVALWCFFCQFKIKIASCCICLSSRRFATTSLNVLCSTLRRKFFFWRKLDDDAIATPPKSETHASLHTPRDSLTITTLPRLHHLNGGQRKWSGMLFNDLIHSKEPIKCDCKNYGLLALEDAQQDGFRGRSISQFIRGTPRFQCRLHHGQSANSRPQSMAETSPWDDDEDFKPRAFSLSIRTPFQRAGSSAACKLYPSQRIAAANQANNTGSSSNKTTNSGRKVTQSSLAVEGAIIPEVSSSQATTNSENGDAAPSDASLGYQETTVKVPLVSKTSLFAFGTQNVSRPITELRTSSLRKQRTKPTNNDYKQIEKFI